MRSSRRAIRIVSQCATAEEFVAAFHPYLERDSLFIATGSPEEPGQAVRFVMTLAGGETVLRGAGRVLECHRDRGNFYGMRGMKLQFDELDDGSRRALAALENRAGGRQGRGAGGHHAGDVLECLIYDEPETESADPAAMGNARGRAARAAAERGLPPTAGDDDVTAVSQAPRPPPRTTAAGLGTGPVPRMQSRTPSSPVQIQAAVQRSTPLPHPPAPAAANHPMSFSVPRPRTEAEEMAASLHPGHPQAGRDAAGRGPSGRMGAMSALTDVSDLPPSHTTRPSPIPSVQVSLNQTGPHPILPSSSAAQGAGSGPLRDYDHQESSRPRMPGGVGREELGLGTGPPHMVPPPEMAGFPPPGDFPGMPPTRTGLRGMPRPPMPAERTEIVRVVRPSHVRTAAMSATLGALLGLAAGYLLWGLDHAALGIGGDDEEAGAEAIPEEAPQPAERPAPPVQARPASAVAEEEPIAEDKPVNPVDTDDGDRGEKSERDDAPSAAPGSAPATGDAGAGDSP